VQVTRIAPSARLVPFIEHFTVVEAEDETTRVLLPEPGLIMGVRYRGAASLLDGDRMTRLSGAAITGIVGAARRMRTHARSGIVLAQFRPTGAARFFAAPLHELFGATVPLDDLLPRAEVQRLADRMASQPDSAHRVAVLEQYLAARLTGSALDPIAQAAAAAIVGAHGSLRISDLARRLGISQDPLEKRFRRAVGASPKQLASIVRVKRAIELGKTGRSWARVAHDTGYYDQSHFIREFRAITGEAPARFFRAVEYC
jgi:AraC-like DNA-binding protein